LKRAIAAISVCWNSDSQRKFSRRRLRDGRREARFPEAPFPNWSYLRAIDRFWYQAGLRPVLGRGARLQLGDTARSRRAGRNGSRLSGCFVMAATRRSLPSELLTTRGAKMKENRCCAGNCHRRDARSHLAFWRGRNFHSRPNYVIGAALRLPGGDARLGGTGVAKSVATTKSDQRAWPDYHKVLALETAGGSSSKLSN